jgi:hypothetical protein
MFLAPVLIAALLGGAHATVPTTAIADSTCPHRNVPLQSRKSPLDSVSFKVGGQTVKVCYGRPSSRGRVMLGGEAVPYGKIWRTGANEPTIFYAPVAMKVAGIAVQPGVYSLYTVPGPSQWEIIVNRSISQWGKEDEYTDAVKAQEVGRAKVKAESVSKPIETFTIRAEPGSSQASLVLEWEKARVRIPVQATK